jgi:hypothetical protein
VRAQQRKSSGRIFGLRQLLVLVVCAWGCGHTAASETAPDATVGSCGAAGQVCCNGTACNNGIVCASSGMCEAPCGSAGEACCNSTACNNGLSCQGGLCGQGGDGGGTEAGGDGSGPSDGAGPTVDACSGLLCSSDLHSVVDCTGKVITACAATEGCAAGTCVPACQAAAANKSAIGCDFYSVTPDSITPAPGACFAAYIANTWTTPVTLSVEYGSQTLNASTFAYLPSGTGQSITYTPVSNGQVPAGQVAILFLDADPMAGTGEGLNFACPPGVSAALTTDSATHGTGIGTAFHISTTAPVVAYDMFPYGGGQSAVTSGTLLLPTSAWDTNYIAIDAFAGGPMSESMGEPYVFVVAQQANTTVTINPSADIVGGTGVSPASQGVATTYTLNAGQVLQLTQDDELQGSIIKANYPVGVWGGITCLNIDLTTCCCDSAHQQIPPIQAFGNEYVGVRYRNRFTGMEESPPWRIVGAVNGTNLTYDPATPSGAPTTLSVGQTVEFDTDGPFVVRSQDSQHPFYVSAHMTGAVTVNPDETDGRGDPEFVNVVPSVEWLSSYVFFTDPTYPETDLVVVRAAGPNGFQDVTLDCLGTVTGWMPVGSGKYQYTRVDLVTGDFMPIGNCNNGRHEMTSTAPFGLTVWGWGSAATGTSTSGFNSQYVSYAYPAGASVQHVNTIVVSP